MEYILILLLAELFEALTQRAATLFEVLEKLYKHYAQSIFLFFLMQPAFYVTLWIVMDSNILNASMIFLLALKIFDMFYKIGLIKKVFIERVISQDIAQMLQWKLPQWYFLAGIVTYPTLLYMALL